VQSDALDTEAAPRRFASDCNSRLLTEPAEAAPEVAFVPVLVTDSATETEALPECCSRAEPVASTVEVALIVAAPNAAFVSVLLVELVLDTLTVVVPAWLPVTVQSDAPVHTPVASTYFWPAAVTVLETEAEAVPSWYSTADPVACVSEVTPAVAVPNAAFRAVLVTDSVVSRLAVLEADFVPVPDTAVVEDTVT
jgi:hypothetical protein